MKQKNGFLSILLGTLGAGLLGNILADKGTDRLGDGIIEAGYGSWENLWSKKNLKNKNLQFQFILQRILKFKSIIRMKLDLM